MTNAGLSIMSPYNDGLSQGSRHILKLTGINREDDMMSIQAQEELYQNEFERDYTRLEKLGEGCSAEVVKCEHKKLNQLMAAKIIRSKDEEYVEIQKKEYHLLRPLNHPNVVRVSNLIHDEFKGQLIMIMEYVQGLTLEDYVLKIQQDKQRMPEQEVAFILRQLV